MAEDEGRGGDLADPVRVECDVFGGGLRLAEQGVCLLGEGSSLRQQLVEATAVGIELAALDRVQDPYSRSLVALVGQSRETSRGQRIQSLEGVGAGTGHVMNRAGLDHGNSFRVPGEAGQDLDVLAVVMML